MAKFRNTETKFSKESQLLAPIARFAKHKGYQLQAIEVPFYEYRIDFYGYSKTSKTTLAIELKLTDWRGALRQALLYQLCSDFVYIAMPVRSAKRVDVKELREHRVGLIGVNHLLGCSCILQASRHKEVRSFYRSTQVDFLQSTANA